MSESTIITIAELEAVTEAPDSSYIPIDNGEVTNKITVGNFNASSTATATAQALKSEGYATGKQNGADVESGSPYYQNNAAYYAAQANTTKNTVEGYVELAQAAQTTATQKAAAASGSASDAAASATLAGQYADAAFDSASDSATSASSAYSAEIEAKSAATASFASAADALGYKTDALNAKNDAVAAAEFAGTVAVKTPYIGANGNWYVWDTDENDFVDSGEPSKGDKGDTGDTGATGAEGPTGPSGADGVSPGVTITPISGGTQVTITDATHPSGQSFNVLNGAGSGDMLSSTYDANSAVATAGGIASYVSTSISGKADVVSSPTNGDFAALNSSGNITDSGKKASDFAPAAHAADALTYGGGTATNYGHVKLSDAYQTSDGAASASVGASSKAVADSYDTLNQALSTQGSQIQALTNQLEDEAETRAALGAHNLNGTVYKSTTANNVTFTPQNDGTINVTISGSASAQTQISLDSFIAPITAQVILTGGINASLHEYAWDATTNTRPYLDSSKTDRQTNNCTGPNVEIPFYMEAGHKYEINLRVGANATLSDTGTFKPLLRLATDTDTTYQPYAMTNKELTDAKIDASQIAPIENGATASTSYAQGAYFIHNGKFCKAKTSISGGATFTKGTNYEETTVAAELIALAQ